jgi:hypothetical protein
MAVGDHMMIVPRAGMGLGFPSDDLSKSSGAGVTSVRQPGVTGTTSESRVCIEVWAGTMAVNVPQRSFQKIRFSSRWPASPPDDDRPLTIMQGVFNPGISFLSPPLLSGFHIMQDPMHQFGPQHLFLHQGVFPSFAFLTQSTSHGLTDSGTYVQSSYSIVPSIINSIQLVQTPQIVDCSIRMVTPQDKSKSSSEVHTPPRDSKTSALSSPSVINKKLMKLKAEEMTPPVTTPVKGTPPDGVVYVPPRARKKSCQ